MVKKKMQNFQDSLGRPLPGQSYISPDSALTTNGTGIFCPAQMPQTVENL